MFARAKHWLQQAFSPRNSIRNSLRGSSHCFRARGPSTLARRVRRASAQDDSVDNLQSGPNSMHDALLPLFRCKRKMLRVHRLHLNWYANHTIARRAKHIPPPLIFNVVQKIFLIIDFELQFYFSPLFPPGLAFRLADSIRSASNSFFKKSFFHPTPFFGRVTRPGALEIMSRNFGSSQIEFRPNLFFTARSSSTRSSIKPYRSKPRITNFLPRQKRNSSAVRISGSSSYPGSFRSEGMSRIKTLSPTRKPCRRS